MCAKVRDQNLNGDREREERREREMERQTDSQSGKFGWTLTQRKGWKSCDGSPVGLS